MYVETNNRSTCDPFLSCLKFHRGALWRIWTQIFLFEVSVQKPACASQIVSRILHMWRLTIDQQTCDPFLSCLKFQRGALWRIWTQIFLFEVSVQKPACTSQIVSRILCMWRLTIDRQTCDPFLSCLKFQRGALWRIWTQIFLFEVSVQKPACASQIVSRILTMWRLIIDRQTCDPFLPQD